MHLLTLADILTHPIIPVASVVSVQDAWEQMQNQQVRALVVTEGQLPVGIFTERDAVSLAFVGQDAGMLPVGMAMSRPPPTVSLDMDCRAAYQLMLASGVHHLLVTDASGVLAGIVSQRDILERLGMESLKHLPADVPRLTHAGASPPDGAVVQQERELCPRMIESLPGIFYMFDAAGRFLLWNRNFEQVLQRSEEEIRCARPTDFVAGGERILAEAKIREVFETGYATAEMTLVAKDGTKLPYYFTGMQANHGGVSLLVGMGIDIGARKQMEQEWQESEARLRRLNRVYTVLSGITMAIARIRDSKALLAEACRIAVETGGFRMAWVGRVEEDGSKLVPVAHAGLDDGHFEIVRISLADGECGCNPSGQAWRIGKYQVCNDLAGEPCMEPWREAALQRGYLSVAAFPIAIGGTVRGVFTLYAATPDFFDTEEQHLLVRLAEDIGFALEFAEIDAARKARRWKLTA